MKDVLFLSNGHGEDGIAVRILTELQALRPALTVDAWPMVGSGAAWRQTTAGLVGVPNLLPSAGFATLEPGLMMRDLKAGWLGTHWRQLHAARALASRYRLIVAVGDIIPLAAALMIGPRRVFVGCAKSAYYRSAAYRYNALERLLMKGCLRVFPRDAKTSVELQSAGIAAVDAGNPMMDGLEPSGAGLGLSAGERLVAVLPGSRDDAPANIVALLAHLARAAAAPAMPSGIVFAFAIAPGTALETVSRDSVAGWTRLPAHESVPGLQLALGGPNGSRVIFLRDRFADVLHGAELAIGMSGTGNEQAVGLGLPLIAIPSDGVQGTRFVAMKAEYFGASAVTLDARAGELSSELAGLLGNPERRARMGEAGRERMGEPGASRAIAREIAELLSA